MEEKIPTALKSIRLKCLDCSCGSSKEVELCPVTNCPLYPHRFGKSIARSGKQMSEEQRLAAKKRMQELHAKRKEERGLPE